MQYKTNTHRQAGYPKDVEEEQGVYFPIKTGEHDCKGERNRDPKPRNEEIKALPSSYQFEHKLSCTGGSSRGLFASDGP